MKKIEKPWGFETIWANCEKYVGKILHIRKGNRLSKQYHQVKEETIYVLSGTLYNMDNNNNIIKILEGESFHVYPHQIHRFCAKESDVILVEVITPHLDDVVRLEDDYNR